MYIDRHDSPGLTPEEVAEAHNADLTTQDKYGVRYHTYWFDPANGSVFCLAEGPSQAAVEAVHQEAHGSSASIVVEIDPTAPLNAFFGALPDFPAGTPYTAPAMRAIVFTDMCGSVAQTYEVGDDAHLQLLQEHNGIVRSALTAHGGREVKHTGDGIMAAFTSVAAAVRFAIDVQRAFAVRNESAALPCDVRIGISAGEPLTDGTSDLFGASVQLAARLCDAAAPAAIAVSVAVRELCIGKPFQFDDLGELSIKGVPGPVRAYGVPWRS